MADLQQITQNSFQVIDFVEKCDTDLRPSIERFEESEHYAMHRIFSITGRGEWPSGLYSLRQVTEVKLGRVRSDFGWVTSKD